MLDNSEVLRAIAQVQVYEILWTDPWETPLEAIGRLNQEVIELEQKLKEAQARA